MPATLTLTDVAKLANVTRQAVTNWRRRPTVRGEHHPFPAPVGAGEGVEAFDRDEVLDWLAATRRGRNEDARLDAQALTTPDEAGLKDVVTVLALRTVVGEDLTGRTAAEIEALAAEVDPADRALRSEMGALSHQPGLLAYVDDLFAASYGPTDALARLRATRLYRSHGERGLSDDVIDLLAAAADASLQHLGDAAIALDVETAAYRVARVAEAVVVDDPEARELRRHLLIERITDVTTAPRVVHVSSLVGRDDQEVLDRVDAIAVDLPPEHVAIVLGPASALCDRLHSKLAADRMSTLTVGNLVAAFRLPRGLWRAAHRQALGLWALKGGVHATRLVVADLTSQPIERGEFAADVLGALEQSNARAYRYGRALRHEQARVHDVLVPTGITAARLGGVQPSHRDAVVAASLVTARPLEGFDLHVAPAEPALISAPRSLGQMIDDGTARLLNGSRIDEAHTEPNATTRILSARPGAPALRIDPLVVATHYEHAQRTEPGDVVFVDRPRPAAVLDDFGGSLVLAPSRILRLRDRPDIGPRALTETINQLPDDSVEWRTWRLPRFLPQQVDDVEAALDSASAHLDELRRREAATQDLITHLVQGVSVGDLAIELPTPRKKVG